MSFQRQVRYESLDQIERFKRAAKLKRWSLNTFILAAAEAAATATEEEAEGKEPKTKLLAIKWGLHPDDSHL